MNYRQAQRAWDAMEPPCDEDCEERREQEEPEEDDTDWDAIDYGNFYEGDK